MNINKLFLLGIFVSVVGLIAFEMSYAQLQESSEDKEELCQDRANSISLKLLKWREAIDLDELKAGTNIEFLPEIDGFRAGEDNLIQRGPVDGKDPETDKPISISTNYPVKTQFLVVAKVPNGVKEVVWNLSNAEADIIGVPQGSKFLADSRVITPVGAGQVQIENVQYALVAKDMVAPKLQLPNDWESKLDRAEHGEFPDFYILSGGGGGLKKRCEYMKSFGIANDESYIVITASRLGETDIVAYAPGLDSRLASVYATVEWVEQPPPFIDPGEPPSPVKYYFVANVTDSTDPITVNSEAILELTVSMLVDKISAPIPTNLLVFRLEGDFPTKGWWNLDGKYVIHRKFAISGEKELLPGKEYKMNVSVTVPPEGKYDKSFIVKNTELRFVGPVKSNERAGYVIITNESTTVRPKAREISGFGTKFMTTRAKSDGVVFLQNQRDGTIYEIYWNTNFVGNLTPKDKPFVALDVGTAREVKIKFKISPTEKEPHTVIVRN